jgi:hypothetical protein
MHSFPVSRAIIQTKEKEAIEKGIFAWKKEAYPSPTHQEGEMASEYDSLLAEKLPT